MTWRKVGEVAWKILAAIALFAMFYVAIRYGVS